MEDNIDIRDVISKYFGIILILLIGLVFRLIHFSKGYALWWDSYIYLGMANVVSSFGIAGFWEVFRPLVHPVFLGLFGIFGFDILSVGIFLDFLFSLLSIYLVYLIGKNIWSEKVGLLASLLFAIEPLFILYTGLVLTEPLVIFLGLLAAYLLLAVQWKKHDALRLGLVGILVALSAMTKFPSGLLIIPVGVYLLCLHFRFGDFTSWLKKSFRDIFCVAVGFASILTAFLIINQVLYGNFLLPFTSGSWIVQTYKWLYNNSFWYYFEAFFVPVSFYLLFFVYGMVVLFLKKYRRSETLFVFLSGFILLLYFIFGVARKEVRYMTLLLPWMILASSAVIFWLFDFTFEQFSSKVFWKKAISILVLVLVTIWILFSFVWFHSKLSEDMHYEDASILAGIFHLEKVISEGDVLLSSHPFILQLPVRLDPLTADPVIALRALELSLESSTPASYVVFRDCDFLCQEGDSICLTGVNTFEEKVTQVGVLEFEQSLEGCTLQIYSLS